MKMHDAAIEAGYGAEQAIAVQDAFKRGDNSENLTPIKGVTRYFVARGFKQVHGDTVFVYATDN